MRGILLATANAGVPMLVLQLPAMIALLIPVILLEWAIASRRLRLSRRECLNGVAWANVVSTLVGIPIAWALMFGLDLLTTGSEALGLETPAQKLVAVTLQAAWLPPYEGELSWMIPTASLTLLVPSFLVSVFMEVGVLYRRWPMIPSADISRTTWLVNICSYSLLVVVACGFLLRSFPSGS